MLSFKKVNKFYNTKHVLHDISFEIKQGICVSIIGYSGSGKTSIARIITGLEYQTDGEVFVPKKVGFISQSFDLFENMTVYENITYKPIQIDKKSTETVNTKVDEILRELGIFDIKNASVMKISGGQKQRVAIARCLINDPEVIVMDEPTSALDAVTIKDFVQTIKKIKSHEITIVVITHDLNFAKLISDEVMFVKNGKIVDFMSVADFGNKSKLQPDTIEFVEHFF
jgi:ABC-type polar amino acid transport system ATPase subunit